VLLRVDRRVREVHGKAIQVEPHRSGGEGQRQPRGSDGVGGFDSPEPEPAPPPRG
jgi:hypothetical protein